MEPKNTIFSKILTKIKSSDFIYLIILFLFFIIVVILFFYSTNFIVNNVNKIFSLSNGIEAQPLDVGRYSLVAKKLNLPVNTEGESPAIPPATTPATTPPITPTIIPAVPPTTAPATTPTIIPAVPPTTAPVVIPPAKKPATPK